MDREEIRTTMKHQAKVLRPTDVTFAGAEPLTESGTNWLEIVDLLWADRRLLYRVAAVALVAAALVAFLIPKHYESKVRIMPPDQPGGAAAIISALASKGMPSGMGALAGSLLGAKNNGALFVDLLHSRTVQDDIVDRFDLQKVYWRRYKEDARKKLESRTDVAEDRKSGVISITVTDTDPNRARAMAEAYVHELDKLVAQVSTSAARRQRLFLEQRLAKVQEELEAAERELSAFSSKNMTLDIKEQTKAMVTAGATLEAQLIAAQTELSGLQQVYGDENVRVRGTKARIAELQRQIEKMGDANGVSGGSELSPPLRQLPVLGVRWADLYRTTKVHETVFELLTQQYEMAKVEEAKEIPTVQVIDPPNFPEKKSWPPRLLLIAAGVLISLAAASAWIVINERATTFTSLKDSAAGTAVLRFVNRTRRHGQNGEPR